MMAVIRPFRQVYIAKSASSRTYFSAYSKVNFVTPIIFHNTKKGLSGQPLLRSLIIISGDFCVLMILQVVFYILKIAHCEFF